MPMAQIFQHFFNEKNFECGRLGPGQDVGTCDRTLQDIIVGTSLCTLFSHTVQGRALFLYLVCKFSLVFPRCPFRRWSKGPLPSCSRFPKVCTRRTCLSLVFCGVERPHASLYRQKALDSCAAFFLGRHQRC